MALPFSVGALRGLLKEVESSARDQRPLVVGGARELAAVLRRDLARGARPGAMREGDAPEGGAVLVYVLGRDPDAGDEAALRRARRARVPIVAVAAGPVSPDAAVPQVPATDVVRVAAGEGFPLDAIARAVARRLGEAGAPLAARVPLLREAVCGELVAATARRNGILAAAIFVPGAGSARGGAAGARPDRRGADLPVLTLNQLRLVLRIAQAHGEQPGRERLAELAATVAAGFGLRAAARELLDLLPVGGWAVKGAVAYAGTRALGEAAVRRFAATRPPA